MLNQTVGVRAAGQDGEGADRGQLAARADRDRYGGRDQTGRPAWMQSETGAVPPITRPPAYYYPEPAKGAGPVALGAAAVAGAVGGYLLWHLTRYAQAGRLVEYASEAVQDRRLADMGDVPGWTTWEPLAWVVALLAAVVIGWAVWSAADTWARSR